MCVSSVYSLTAHFNHADLRKWQIVLTSREESEHVFVNPFDAKFEA